MVLYCYWTGCAYQWPKDGVCVSVTQGRGVRISGPILKSKSEELAKKLGHNDFTATEGYHDRKLGITLHLRKHHGEKDGADKVGAEEWKSTKIPILLQNFCADDIYNADETGLYYRVTPDGSLCQWFLNLCSPQTTFQEFFLGGSPILAVADRVVVAARVRRSKTATSAGGGLGVRCVPRPRRFL